MSTDTSNLNQRILEKKMKERTEEMEKETASGEMEDLRQEITEIEEFESSAGDDVPKEVDELVLEEIVQAESEKSALEESAEPAEETAEIPEEEPAELKDVEDETQEPLAEDAETAEPQGIPDLDEMQEENRKQKEELKELKKAAGIKDKKKGPSKKTWIIIAALALAACLCIFAYNALTGGKAFTETAEIGTKLENEKTRCVVKDIVVINKLLDSKAADGKTFICVSYQYKNLSSEELVWEDFPLLSVGAYESDEPNHRPKQTFGNSSINKAALHSYSYISGVDLEMAKDPLPAGEVREDIDVFEVDESVFDNYSLYITFDLYNQGIKIDKDKMNKLPSIKETLKTQKKKIKKEQKKKGIKN